MDLKEMCRYIQDADVIEFINEKNQVEYIFYPDEFEFLDLYLVRYKTEEVSIVQVKRYEETEFDDKSIQLPESE